MRDPLDVLPANAPRGIWGAVLLAIGRDGAIDWGATRETIASLCASGVHGVYSNGTACEFHGQVEAEFERLSALAAEEAGRAGIPFQIGISSSNARVARERLRRISALVPAAAQFTLPDWWPPTMDEILRFVSGLAEAAPGVPLVLYNPPHAKRRLSLEEIARLREAVPAVIGAKLPGGDAAWFEAVRTLLPGFSVFVPGHTLASGYRAGAHGSYSNVACLSPRGALLWWEAIRRGDADAMETEARVQQFLAERVLPFRTRFGVSDAGLDKAMAAAGGWGRIGPRLLWPYGCVPEREIAPLAAAARAAFPAWF
jgi:dihydrodipicolinate synthase/N-acetylneuraminate lyase